jgi:hypothetical protein
LLELRVPLLRAFFAEPGGAELLVGRSSLDSAAACAVVSGECDVRALLVESLLLLIGKYLKDPLVELEKRTRPTLHLSLVSDREILGWALQMSLRLACSIRAFA